MPPIPGGDGGSIPTRRCLVKPRHHTIIKNPHDDNVNQYGYCQHSANKLKRPIVASRIGKLYNKDAVIEYLLDRGAGGNETADGIAMGINSLKDIYDVKVTDNPEFANFNVEASDSSTFFPFMCEITKAEMNGTQRFVFGTKCKTVISEKALMECNKNLLPKIKMVRKDGELHSLYNPEIEDQLEDPMTSKPFGRPILLYPVTPAEIARAQDFQLSSRKRKKSKKSKTDDCKKPKQNPAVSTINMPSVKKITNDVGGDLSKSKQIDAYRKLKLIGDTSNLKDNSATAKLFSYSRPYFK